jgi:streptogramin lyase
VVNDTWGDHVHVETHWHYPDGSVVTKQGEQYGLAIFPNGDLLTAAEYGVGRQEWNVDPKAWALGRYAWALTTYGTAEPYNTGPHQLDVPAEYREKNRGAAITPDGTSWWVSSTTGLSSYSRGDFTNTAHYTSIPGLPASGLMDIAADPDGTLWIVDNGGRLLRFNPSNSSVQVWPGVSSARRVVVDMTVIPRAVYVSMGSQGLAVIRAR